MIQKACVYYYYMKMCRRSKTSVSYNYNSWNAYTDTTLTTTLA